MALEWFDICREGNRSPLDGRPIGLARRGRPSPDSYPRALAPFAPEPILRRTRFTLATLAHLPFVHAPGSLLDLHRPRHRHVGVQRGRPGAPRCGGDGRPHDLRSVAAVRPALSHDRTGPWRPGDRGHRRRAGAVDLLFRLDGRRRLEDHRCRRELARSLAAGLRVVIDRRARCRQLGSERDLRGHGVGGHPQQCFHRQGDLQVDRRGQDVALLGAARRRTDRLDQHSSYRPERRLRGRRRESVRAHDDARHLPHEGRRRHVGECALSLRQHRRRGHRVQARQSEHPLRVDVAWTTPPVDHHQRRRRGRHLQEHRRWRPLDAARRRAPHRRRRQERPRSLGRRARSRVRARRGKGRRRSLSQR